MCRLSPLLNTPLILFLTFSSPSLFPSSLSSPSFCKSRRKISTSNGNLQKKDKVYFRWCYPNCVDFDLVGKIRREGFIWWVGGEDEVVCFICSHYRGFEQVGLIDRLQFVSFGEICDSLEFYLIISKKSIVCFLAFPSVTLVRCELVDLIPLISRQCFFLDEFSNL